MNSHGEGIGPTGISITNLDSGGHLATCTGNIVRNTILNIWYLSQADANNDVYRQPDQQEKSLARAAAA